MTIIDVVAALEEGSLPTNNQLTDFLSRIQSSKTLNPSTYSTSDPSNSTSTPADPNSINSDELSNSTKTLAQDFHGLLSTVQELIKERNGDEELQTFLWRTRGSLLKVKEEGGKKLTLTRKGKKEQKEKELKELEKKSEGKKSKLVKVKQDGNQALHHLKTLARLVLIQPELRHIIADLGFLAAEIVEGTLSETLPMIQDDLGQVSTTTGNFQVEGKETLKKTDQEIMQEGSTFEGQAEAEATASSSTATTSKDPQQANLLASSVETAVNNAVSNATSKMDASKEGTSPAKNESLEALKAQTLAKAESVSTDVQALKTQLDESTSPDVLKGTLSGLQSKLMENGTALAKDPKALESLLQDPSKLKTHLKNPELMQSLREGVSRPIISAKDGDSANDLNAAKLLDVAQLGAVANDGTHLLEKERLKRLGKQSVKTLEKNSKESWNDERKRKLISRMRKLCVDCQRNEEYSEALLWFISKIESAATSVQDNIGKPSIKLDKSLSEASEPLVKLIENFSDGRDLKSILTLAKSLSVGAKDEPSIRGFWKDTDTFIRKCLLEPGFAIKPQCETEGKELFQRFKKLNQQYKEDVANLISQSASFALAIKEDSLLKRLTKNGKDIGKHVLVSSDGKWFKNKALLSDAQLILKGLFDRLGVLPIPRIVYKHPDFELVIENIALQLKHLLPNMLDIKFDNDVHLDFERIKESTHSHRLKIKVKGMSLRVHKLAFAFTSKFAPKGLNIYDKGIADVLIGGFGLSIYIDVPKNPGLHFFEVRKVKTKLKTLSIKVRQSNHRILHALASSLVDSFLTKLILKHFISYGVSLGLKQLDLVLMEAKLNRGQETEDLTFEEVQKRIAALRDLLAKYREQAGTLEIDFTREEDPENVKRWEDAHAIKYVKDQLERTAKKDIVRNQWRSNAFDATDELSFEPPAEVENLPETQVDKLDPNDHRPADGNPESESPAEAFAQGKTEPTTSETVKRAEKDLVQAEKEMKEEEKIKPQDMESKIGSTAIKENPGDAGKQAEKIEDRLEIDLEKNGKASSQKKGGTIGRLFGKKKKEKLE